MKYQANPVIVDAYKIVSVGEPRGKGGIMWWSVDIALENGENVVADSGMLARYTPSVGDYWVVQEDGYTYLNPKEVFERKYSPFENEKEAA